ncbi:MAG TPA: ABC transporter substrate-binding protein [Spirochaetia bacterium]|nr:ABC transporter substrate-binding protein [Spirochaetia bacterium]
MKRLSFLLASIAIFVVACTPYRPVTIGLIAPLTGPSSAVGIGVRNGFRMAFGESVLKKGVAGHPIQLEIRDDHNDADVGLADIRELDKQGC